MGHSPTSSQDCLFPEWMSPGGLVRIMIDLRLSANLKDNLLPLHPLLLQTRPRQRPSAPLAERRPRLFQPNRDVLLKWPIHVQTQQHGQTPQPTHLEPKSQPIVHLIARFRGFQHRRCQPLRLIRPIRQPASPAHLLRKVPQPPQQPPLPLR